MSKIDVHIVSAAVDIIEILELYAVAYLLYCLWSLINDLFTPIARLDKDQNEVDVIRCEVRCLAAAYGSFLLAKIHDYEFMIKQGAQLYESKVDRWGISSPMVYLHGKGKRSTTGAKFDTKNEICKVLCYFQKSNLTRWSLSSSSSSSFFFFFEKKISPD